MDDVTHLEGGWLGRGANLCTFGVENDPPPGAGVLPVDVNFSFAGAGGFLLEVVSLFEEAGEFLWVDVGLLVKSGTACQFRGVNRK